MNNVISGKIPSKDLFMICENVNKSAFSELPSEYYFRECRRDELKIWKGMHLDFPHSPEQHKEFMGFMDKYYDETYAPNEELFFKVNSFVCNSDDIPIGRGFIWKYFNKINTIAWYKVLREYEGKGIGRAILTKIMKDLREIDYPVYLHTHPSSFRAIKLYSDFGFKLLSDPKIGYRKNDLVECLPILEKYIPEKFFKNIEITNAPKEFLEIVESGGNVNF